MKLNRNNQSNKKTKPLNEQLCTKPKCGPSPIINEKFLNQGGSTPFVNTTADKMYVYLDFDSPEKLSLGF